MQGAPSTLEAYKGGKNAIEFEGRIKWSSLPNDPIPGEENVSQTRQIHINMPPVYKPEVEPQVVVFGDGLTFFLPDVVNDPDGNGVNHPVSFRWLNAPSGENELKYVSEIFYLYSDRIREEGTFELEITLIDQLGLTNAILVPVLVLPEDVIDSLT